MPVSDQELTTLAHSHDIINIGMVADEIRRRLHGTRTTFVRVANVPVEEGGPLEWSQAAGEIRIVGTPASRSSAVARVKEVVARAGGVPVSAYLLTDLEQLAARDGVPLRALLEELRAVGLELISEASFDLLHEPRRSVEEMNISGLTLARLTVERSPSVDPLPQLKGVANLQRAVAVIRAFAPLPRKMNPTVPTTGYDDVKRVALARAVVENVLSIQVDWALYGPKLAQVALTMGADDVDTVSPEEDTGQGRRREPLAEILRNIRAAGLEPFERNGRFDLLRREEGERAQ